MFTILQSLNNPAIQFQTIHPISLPCEVYRFCYGWLLIFHSASGLRSKPDTAPSNVAQTRSTPKRSSSSAVCGAVIGTKAYFLWSQAKVRQYNDYGIVNRDKNYVQSIKIINDHTVFVRAS
jgi:hypothetical protein